MDDDERGEDRPEGDHRHGQERCRREAPGCIGRGWRWNRQRASSRSQRARAISIVNVSDVPARCVASIRFSGNLGNEAGEVERQTLSRWIETPGLERAGDWQMARYNPPLTISMLRRNEVLVTPASCP